MYCANCGAKIEDEQKFCHACGATNVNSSDDDVDYEAYEEDTDDDNDSTSSFDWFYEVIPYLIIAAVLLVFAPSEYKVKSEVAHELITKVSDRVGDYMGVDNFGAIIDGDSFDDDEAIKIAERFGTITVKNFMLFKVAYFKPVNKKKERFVAIGVCGFVITP